jgi:hypothetical protein
MSMHKFRLAAMSVLTLAVLAGVWAFAQPPEKKPADKDTEKKEDKALAAPQGLEVRNKLRKTVDYDGLDDPKATFTELLEQLQRIYKVTFDVNEKAFTAEKLDDVLRVVVGNPPIPAMKDVTLTHLLRKALLRIPVSSGATFLIRKDFIEITTARAVRRELGLGDDDKSDDVTTTLPPLVWEDLRKVPLDRALRDIAEDTGVNVILDPRAEKQGSLELTTTLRNVPVDTAVDTLAEIAGLAVVRRNNVLFVTTPEKAERMLEGKRWSGQPRKAAPKADKARES